MKRALVLGASGGMGYAITKELLQRGIVTVAFARDKTKLDKLFGKEDLVELYPGDAMVREDIVKATKDVDVIFHAINIPYEEWDEKLPVITQNIVDATRCSSAKLAIVDNIYAYGKSNGLKMKETAVKNPNTRKGKIRLQLEKMIDHSNVPYVRVHFPDFYGPYVENSYLNHVIRSVLENNTAYFVGKQNIAREFIYTPDGAKAMVELANHDDCYGENWNIPGSDVISGKEAAKIISDYTGYKKSVRTATKNMLRFLGIFDKQMRELVEMQYLNENPVVLDGAKYEERVGEIPKTPFQIGLKNTIDSYQ